ncbi:hypothetical protein A4A49_13408 [Nicotiana attenuata]|uniref:Uncharacterized protein n=1 Tax=Nicotiana attenuata TaxID=49451 RepID=A0A314KM08_NICAT|nr:hypothetical protein A4A49_13408 [Nicotiana attenuata]
MDYHDIFYELDPIFDGDEWDHRLDGNISSDDQSHKDVHQFLNEELQQKASADGSQKMDMQENGDDKDLEMLKVEVNGKKEATESGIKSQVERRTNPRRVNRRAHKAATSSTSSPDQSGNLEEKRCKRERINAEDFTLPKGWIIEVRVRKNGITSGHKDTVINNTLTSSFLLVIEFSINLLLDP